MSCGGQAVFRDSGKHRRSFKSSVYHKVWLGGDHVDFKGLLTGGDTGTSKSQSLGHSGASKVSVVSHIPLGSGFCLLCLVEWRMRSV